MAWLVAGLLALCVVCTPLAAQEKKPAKKTEKTEEEEIPPPQEETLVTPDGVKLAMTYYPGTKGKDSIPVVLLHGFKGSRKDFSELAPYLQEKLGCAVLVPDLRGHGDSTTQTKRLGPKTVNSPLSATSSPPMPTQHYALMVTHDMGAIKNFLWEKNNLGELNIDKTCVIGADMGASVALDYALWDSVGYEQGSAQYGPLKLGCFVKALVLMSPEWGFKGLKTAQALSSPHVRSNIDVMILVGKGGSKSMQEASRVHQAFEKARLDKNRAEREAARETQTLFFGRLDTTLQGTKLLGEKSLNVPEHVRRFIFLRLVKSVEAKTYVWKERKRPHE